MTGWLIGGGAAAIWAGGLVYASIAPRNALWGPVVWKGSESGSARCALTFDDGPWEGATEKVLDALGEVGVKAAFFVIGVNVERWPRIVKRIHEEGHVVGNHSWDHSHFGSMGWGKYWDEQIRRTDDAVAGIIGTRPAMFRPPMGVRSPYIAGAARRAGHVMVTWSRRAFDGFGARSERIIGRLAPHALPGEILLLHDGVEPNRRRDPSGTVGAVRGVIEGLRRRGIEPVRLDELVGLPAYSEAAGT